MRRYVCSRNLVNEEAMAHWGAVAPQTNKQTNPNFTSVSTLQRKVDLSLNKDFVVFFFRFPA